MLNDALKMASLRFSITSPISCNSFGNLCSERCNLEFRIVQSSNSCAVPVRKFGFYASLHRNGFSSCSLQKYSIQGEKLQKDVILVSKGRKRSLVLVSANRGFGFNGGGGWDKSTTTRVLGNLALAIGLTYLTMTGQLGWVLDAIVSIWLLAVLLPIAGLGVFFWFVGRDIVRGSCPNCGNEFQIFKSSTKDGPQLCPFCSQPFSVQGNEFVRESARFSPNHSTAYEQIFNRFSPREEKGKASSTAVVDIEAEVKDIE